eukprot:3949988-Lingulodinium_polyedra.AAC.1
MRAKASARAERLSAGRRAQGAAAKARTRGGCAPSNATATKTTPVTSEPSAAEASVKTRTWSDARGAR